MVAIGGVALPSKVYSIPTSFHSQPFRFLDHNEAASIKKQAAGREAMHMNKAGPRFYIDFCFLKAFIFDYGSKQRAGELTAVLVVCSR